MFKKILFLILTATFISCSVENKMNEVFELYPTESNLVFLRLDTRFGYIWMVEGSTDSITHEQIIIQDHPLDFDNETHYQLIIDTRHFYMYSLLLGY